MTTPNEVTPFAFTDAEKNTIGNLAAECLQQEIHDWNNREQLGAVLDFIDAIQNVWIFDDDFDVLKCAIERRHKELSE